MENDGNNVSQTSLTDISSTPTGISPDQTTTKSQDSPIKPPPTGNNPSTPLGSPPSHVITTQTSPSSDAVPAVSQNPTAQPQVAAGGINGDKTKATGNQTQEKAGFIVRLAAYMIDSFMIIIPITILTVAIFGGDEDASNTLSGLTFLVYLTVATGLFSTTVGKRLFHLRVVRVEGGDVGMGKAFVREFLGKIVSSIVLLLGYLWVIWDKDKQGWHDKIAKTFVVFTEPLSKGRKILAYAVALILPLLALAGIAAVVALVAINPQKQLERAKEAEERQKQMMENQQQELEQLENPNINY